MSSEITPADRAAAAAFTLASGEWIQEDLLAEHFAAWRVKERERCVELATNKASILRQLASEDGATGQPRWQAKHSAQARAIDELITNITPEANNDP